MSEYAPPLDYRVDLPDPLHERAWITVAGDALEQPIELKLRFIGRRPVITALRFDNDHEITGRTLRQLRLKEIGAAVHQEIMWRLSETSGEIRKIEDRLSFEFGYQDIDAIPRGSEEAEYWYASQLDDVRIEREQLAQWLDQLRTQSTGASGLEESARGRGAQAPSPQEYADFARIYIEERLADPRHAAAHAGKRAHMSRQTAYRWIAACRERGLLPKELD